MRIFIEEQRFNQIWLIALILVSILIPIGIILSEYVKDPNSFSTIELVSIIAFILLVSGLIFVFKLSTRIDEEGIHYKFFPFHWSFRVINWNEIENIYVRHYDAISEYGGWGLKSGAIWNNSKGKAINVSGSIGIQLELKNGKKLLIGTKKQNEAEKCISYLYNKI